MAKDLQFEAAVTEICAIFNVESLRKEQQTILDSLISKKDCMAVLPTGYGKSLPYQMYLPLIRRLKNTDASVSDGVSSDIMKKVKEIDLNEKILVCCPLVSLMNDQVQRLAEIPNLRAAYKGKSCSIA